MLNPRRKFRETNECPFFASRLRRPFLATLMVSHDCPPRRFSPPRALFTADLAGTRAPRKRERRKQSGGGRFIALERLGYYLRTALHEFILSLAYKFEISNASSRYSMRDNYSFEMFGGLWKNQVWKWHLARILGCVLEEEWFRIFDFYNEYLSKSDTRISTIFQKSGSERCLLMFNVSLRVSFAVKRRSRNRNLRDLCGNSHEPGCQRNIKDELKCSLEIREMYERLVWKIKSRP